MGNPGVGFQYPAVPVTWYKRDVLLFANSIGATSDELHFLYVSWRAWPDGRLARWQLRAMATAEDTALV